jgi:hypothetical protein
MHATGVSSYLRQAVTVQQVQRLSSPKWAELWGTSHTFAWRDWWKPWEASVRIANAWVETEASWYPDTSQVRHVATCWADSALDSYSWGSQFEPLSGYQLSSHGFLQSFKESARAIPSNRPLPPPSKSLPTHHSWSSTHLIQCSWNSAVNIRVNQLVAVEPYIHAQCCWL